MRSHHTLWTSIVFGLCIAFVTLAQAVDWQAGDQYRFAPLPPSPNGQAGFTVMLPAATGVTATNILSEERALRNQNLMNGAGVAAGDFDGDGLVDFFLVSMDGNSVLYRNLGGWKFQDVTAASGISTTNRIPTGAAFADINGDGRLDLIVTASGGPNSVFINDGAGKFREAILPPGEVPRTGSESIALADVDGDGDLDLYVTNYGEISILRGGINPGTTIVNGKEQVVGRYKNRIKIRPDGTFSESGEPHVLYLNDGKGNFTPAPWGSETFLDEEGKPMPAPWDMGLSVMFGDLNRDGFPDIYVCDDFQTEDRIWINDGKGHFRLIDRLALRNTSNFSMSVDFGDINGDGLPDIFVVDMLSPSHFRRMTQMDPGERPPWHPGVIDDRPQIRRNTFFLNRGDGTFAEIANLAGVAATDWTWCAAFLDVDLDGYPDLLVTNGHMRDVQDMDTIESQRARGKATGAEGRRRLLEFPPLNTPHVAFRNRGDLTFEDASARWGFDARHVSQGIALADLDGDGDLDVIVNSLNAPPLLYRNNSSAPRIAVRLAGIAPNTRGIGAKIKVTARGLPVQTQEMIAGGRYLSGDETERMFAAGSAAQLAIEVTWRSGKRSIITDAKPNCLYEIDEAGSQAVTVPPPPPLAPFFTDASAALQHTHHEELFDDFARQPLLPRLYSQLGPGISCVDLNGDGHDDLVIGSGRGGSIAVYLGDGHGGLKAVETPALKGPLMDDTAGMAGWVLKSGQRSVLIGLANYESGATNGPAVLQLGIDSQGAAMLQTVSSIRLPSGTSPGPLAVADYDADGDLDLFIGGRVSPGRYPENPVSQLYKNEGGNLVLDEANTAALQGAGMVSGAVWSDLDGDGFPELILACEWSPVRVFRNEKGKLREATREWGLASQTGWWQSVAVGDFDGDGKPDLIAGNWGLNSAYHASPAQPARFYYGDFDDNGTLDVIEAEDDPETKKIVPRRTRLVLGPAMPFVQAAYPTHKAYAAASVADILGAKMKTAREVTANTLATMLWLNRGDHFEAVPLPVEAQFTPVSGISVADFDGDGVQDIFLAQNQFAQRGEDPRQDAGRGLWLRGDGKGGFKAMPGQESGVKVYGEQRGCAVADFDEDGRADLVVTQNGAATKLYHNAKVKPGLRVRLAGPAGNPDGIGATVRLVYGERLGPAREIHAGAGYWSQDSTVLVLGGGNATGVQVQWSGGKVVTARIPSGAAEISINEEGVVKVIR